MPTPTVRNVKVYAVVESTIEIRHSTLSELHEYLRQQKFAGKYTVNYQQGGITNVVTCEHLALTAEELDFILKRRQA